MKQNKKNQKAVFTYRNYDFIKHELKFMDINRKPNNIHVQNLVAELRNGNIFVAPLLVEKDTNYVIDGQHRIMAYIYAIEHNIITADMQLPILFMTVSNAQEMCKRCNIKQRNWKSSDYLQYNNKKGIYCDINKQLDAIHNRLPKLIGTNYTILKSSGKFSYNRFLYMCMRTKDNKITYSYITQEFQNGTLPINNNLLQRGEIIATEITNLFNALNIKLPAVNDTLKSFITYWIEQREIYSITTLINVIKDKKNYEYIQNHHNKFTKMQDWEDLFLYFERCLK
jgi:disulfide oxidoreductase YuzD